MYTTPTHLSWGAGEAKKVESNSNNRRDNSTRKDPVFMYVQMSKQLWLSQDYVKTYQSSFWRSPLLFAALATAAEIHKIVEDKSRPARPVGHPIPAAPVGRLKNKAAPPMKPIQQQKYPFPTIA